MPQVDTHRGYQGHGDKGTCHLRCKLFLTFIQQVKEIYWYVMITESLCYSVTKFNVGGSMLLVAIMVPARGMMMYTKRTKCIINSPRCSNSYL